MRILRGMNDNTLKDGKKKETIKGKLKVAPREDKMRENRLRWFGQ